MANQCGWDYSQSYHPKSITSYQSQLFVCEDESHQKIISLRQFTQNNLNFSLVIDPSTLTPIVKSQSCLSSCELLNDLEKIKNTKYGNALLSATSSPFPLGNDGVIKASYPTPSIFLTMDLCPSKNGLELNFIKKWVEDNRSTRKIAIAITGLWMKHHTEEFNWLRQEQRSSNLEITWVNHSHSHPYVKGIPDSNNFLLTSSVSMKNETLLTELTLLESGETPSIFFRFPGLISNEEKINFLKESGLIPLGAEAWVGKGQKIKPGSVILIHGNGNEPKGIALIEQWFQQDPSRVELLESLEHLFN